MRVEVEDLVFEALPGGLGTLLLHRLLEHFYRDGIFALN